MPKPVIQNTFLDLVRYVIIFHMTCSTVRLKSGSQVFTILDSWVRRPHTESWICQVTRQSFQGWQVPFAPSFSSHSSSPFRKVQKSTSYPKDTGQYLTAPWSCLIDLGLYVVGSEESIKVFEFWYDSFRCNMLDIPSKYASLPNKIGMPPTPSFQW